MDSFVGLKKKKSELRQKKEDFFGANTKLPILLDDLDF
jgi:hypothetical protein